MLAHVPIGFYTLPVPLYQILVAAVVVVAASFLLIYLAPSRRHGGGGEARVVPEWAVNLMTLGVAACIVFVFVVATFGRQEVAALNAGSLLFWVFIVVFVPIAHCFVGGMFEVCNPWAWAARRLSGGRPLLDDADELLDRVGYWPAVVLLFLLIFGESVSEVVQNPMVLGYAVLVYSALQITMGMLVGDRWYRGGEVFTAITTLASTMAPAALRRDDEGRVRFELGFDAARFLPGAVGRQALITLWLSGVLADGVRQTPIWHTFLLPHIGPSFERLGHFGGIDVGVAAEITFEVLLTWLVFGIFFWVFVSVASATSGLPGQARLERDRLRRMSEVVAPSLIPIAIAYVLAHNLTQVLVVGPLIVTARDATDEDLGALTQTQISHISPSWVWWTQVIAIVVGHIVAVVMSHARLTRAFGKSRDDRTELSGLPALAPALAQGRGPGAWLRDSGMPTPRGLALRADLGWLSAMLIYTATSLWIIAQPITASSG